MIFIDSTIKLYLRLFVSNFIRIKQQKKSNDSYFKIFILS